MYNTAQNDKPVLQKLTSILQVTACASESHPFPHPPGGEAKDGQRPHMEE
jgi:hypothetical protein